MCLCYKRYSSIVNLFEIVINRADKILIVYRLGRVLFHRTGFRGKTTEKSPHWHEGSGNAYHKINYTRQLVLEEWVNEESRIINCSVWANTSIGSM